MAVKPVTVVVVPLPVVIIAPGLVVKVHVPAAGRSERFTLPVDTVQVGWVMVPMVGVVMATTVKLIVVESIEQFVVIINLIG